MLAKFLSFFRTWALFFEFSAFQNQCYDGFSRRNAYGKILRDANSFSEVAFVDKSATKTLYFINKTVDDSSKLVCSHHTCVWPVLPVRRRRAVEAMAALSQGPAPTDTCILVLYV
jgi:hypothetical protein